MQKNNMKPYRFPCPKGGADYRWNGTGFVNGLHEFRILDYSTNSDGWSDALTELHEQLTDGSNPIDLESRRRCLKAIGGNLRAPISEISLLEVGSSSGYMLKEIVLKFREIFVIGSDVIKNSLVRLGAKYPHLPILRFDLTSCPLAPSSIDVVVMLNVLEHIEDDVAALKAAYRILKSSGMLYIEVPHGAWLYDSFDRELMHFRRYSDRRLRDILRESGFRIESFDHIGFLVYPLFCIAKMYGKLFSSDKVVNRQVSITNRNSFFRYIFELERWVGEFITFPTGIRTVVRASPINKEIL